MKKKQSKPIGKLGLSPRLEPHLSPFEPQIQRDNRKKLANKLINSKNKVLEGFGKGLRSVFNTIDIDSAMPTTNNNINRRAGRTALAGSLIVVGGIVALGSNLMSNNGNTNEAPSNDAQCFTFELNDFGSDAEASQIATMISNIENNGQVLRNTERYDDLSASLYDGEPVKVCGDAVAEVAARMPESS